jgi:hypothetical protein
MIFNVTYTKNPTQQILAYMHSQIHSLDDKITA